MSDYMFPELHRWRSIMSPADKIALVEAAITEVIGDAEELDGKTALKICIVVGHRLGVPEHMLGECALALWDDIFTDLESQGWAGGQT